MIPKKYADTARDRPEKYGTALTYYARGHCQRKLEDMVDLFISLSLIASAAFPPSNALDPTFSSLISDPQQALAHLVQADREAAAMLHQRLAGYAALRNFYELRDEDLELKRTQSSSVQDVGWKIKAFKALLAVIDSAADRIAGGLYDKTTKSVVPLDGLMVLLGESMPFIDRMLIFTSFHQGQHPIIIHANFRFTRCQIFSISSRLYVLDESGRKSPGRP